MCCARFYFPLQSLLHCSLLYSCSERLAFLHGSNHTPFPEKFGHGEGISSEIHMIIAIDSEYAILWEIRKINEIQLYFIYLESTIINWRFLKAIFKSIRNDEILTEWFYKGWQVVYTKNLKRSLRGSKKKNKTTERLAILMYQKTVFLRCKSGESLQSSLQFKSKSQQACVQK